MDDIGHTVYTMEIIDKQDSFYQIIIRSGEKSCQISFSPELKELNFIENNPLAAELEENVYQLRKILHNKRRNTFYIGFKLKFILKNNDDAIAFNDLSKLIVLDRRMDKYHVFSKLKTESSFLHIFTDGCFLEKDKKGGYAALFKKPNGKLDLKVGKTQLTSSSLIELLAVIEGLKQAKNIEYLRIISDSRYVIKGLTEWMFNWKLNDWHTAQGEKVKNISYWKEFDLLTQGKYIEFEWVKGHSFHFENTLCDFYAKQAAMKNEPI